MPLFSNALPYALSVFSNAITVSREREARPHYGCEGGMLSVKSISEAALRRPRRCTECGLHAQDQCKAKKVATPQTRTPRGPHRPRRRADLTALSAALPATLSATLSATQPLLT